MAMRFVATPRRIFFLIPFRTSSMPNVDIKATAIRSARANNKQTSVGGIVGGVIGGLALLVITGAIFFWRRRMQQRRIILGSDVLQPFGAQVISVSLSNHYQSKR
jgi:hypothetical protein